MSDQYVVNAYIPVRPIPAPRTTTRSWWARAKSFMQFRDEVRFWLPRLDVPTNGPCAVEIELHDASPRADVDNLAKAILDTLVGPVLRDDCLSVINQLMIYKSPIKRDGFTVRIWENP